MGREEGTRDTARAGQIGTRAQVVQEQFDQGEHTSTIMLPLLIRMM